MAIGTLAGDLDFLKYYCSEKPTDLAQRDELQRALYRLTETVEQLPVPPHLTQYQAKTQELCSATARSLTNDPAPIIIQNTQETVRAIEILFKHYRNALAAYNAGPTKMSRLLEPLQNPDWRQVTKRILTDPSFTAEKREETIVYVDKIRAYKPECRKIPEKEYSHLRGS